MAEMNKEDVAEFYDKKAFSYDAVLEKGFISGMVRHAIRRKLTERFPPGSHLLDIGCGTGDDAVYLAKLGYKVTAIDVSAGMLDIAAKKVKINAVDKLVQFMQLDAEDICTLGKGVFDGAYSDFNALNHINSLRNFSHSLSEVLKPGADFYGVMLGRLSVSEVFSYMLMLRPRVSVQKLFSRGKDFPSYIKLCFPSRVRKIFAENFKLTGIRGFGLFVPPDQFYNDKKFLKFFSGAARIETFFTGVWPFYNFCDHYLLEFRKK